MNILVFKQSAEDISKDISIEKKRHNFFNIEKIVVPNYKFISENNNKSHHFVYNQNKFLFELTRAAYSIFDHYAEVNTTDIFVKTYDCLEVNKNLAEYKKSAQFEDYNENGEFNPITDPQSILRGMFPVRKAKLRELISTNVDNFNVDVFQIHNLSGYPLVHYVGKCKSKAGTNNEEDASLTRVISPAFYIRARDYSNNAKTNLFEDPIRSDYMANFPDFLELGLQVVNKNKLNPE